MKTNTIFIFLIIIFNASPTIYCANEECNTYTGDIKTGIDERVNHAIQNNVYSQCDETECGREIPLNEECLEWTELGDTLFNITFCNDVCFDKAKEKHSCLDRENFKAMIPNHVEVSIPMVFKAVIFSILHPSIFINSPIENANKISTLKHKTDKTLYERFYLYQFDHFCSTQ